MNIWKVILVTLVIFGTGFITGGLIVQRTPFRPEDNSWRHSVSNHTNQGFRPEKALRMDFVTRAKEELDLTQDQREQIETIIRDSQARTRAYWEQCSPQIRAEFKAAQSKIREVLTPAQREKFEEIMKKRRPQSKEDRERRHTDPNSPPLQDTTVEGGSPSD